MTAAPGGGFAGVLEGVVEIDARGAQRGSETEEHGGEEAGGQAEQQHRGVDADLIEARDLAAAEGREGLGPVPGEHQPGGSTGESQQNAFGEQLTEQAHARSAEGGAQRDLLDAPGGASQHQVGDIGAGDQQNEADGAEQNPERPLHAADHLVAQRPHHHADALCVVLRVLAGDSADHGVHLGLRRGGGDSRLEAAEQLQVLAAAARFGTPERISERQEDFGLVRERRLESRRAARPPR